MVVNIPVCIEADDIGEAVAKNVQQEVSATIKRKIDKAICMNVGFDKLVIQGRYTINPQDDPSLVDQAYKKLADEAVDSLLKGFVNHYVTDNGEEIIERICAECANRILRSTKNKKEIVNKLLQLLTADNKQITGDGLVEEIKED